MNNSEPKWPRWTAILRLCVQPISHGALWSMGICGSCLRRIGPGLHKTGYNLERWARKRLGEWAD